MRKGLAHMVWWYMYFHSCAILNFTDGVSGVNHSLAGGERSLLLYLAVSSAMSFCQSESMSLNSSSR